MGPHFACLSMLVSLILVIGVSAITYKEELPKGEE
jgi:hypothetical protein